MRGLVQCDGRCKFVLCTQQQCPRGCFLQKITAALHPNPHFHLHRLRWACGPAIDRPRSTMHALRVCRTGIDPFFRSADTDPLAGIAVNELPKVLGSKKCCVASVFPVRQRSRCWEWAYLGLFAPCSICGFSYDRTNLFMERIAKNRSCSVIVCQLNSMIAYHQRYNHIDRDGVYVHLTIEQQSRF